ncbi:hypothetical protein D3C86_1450400 [compost metagenome]
MADQEGRRQAQRLHPRDLIVVQKGAVLNPVAVIGTGQVFEHDLIGVQRRVDPGVAVGVDADLPPALMGLADGRSQLLGGVVQRAPAVGVQIGLAQIAAAPLVGAVGPGLDGRDAEAVVAHAGLQTRLLPQLHVGGHQGPAVADRRILAHDVAQDVEVPHALGADAAVEQAGAPAAGGLLEQPPDRRPRLLRIRHGHLHDEGRHGGGLLQPSGQVAVRVANIAGLGRIGRVACDPRNLQGLGVRIADVPVGLEQEERVVGRDPIQ